MVRLIESGKQNIFPDVRKVMDEVAAEAAKAGYTLNIIYGSTTFPDHNNRRCLDFMISHLPAAKQVAAGNWIADYVLKHRTRLGFRFMIWNRRVIRSYAKPGIPANTWARYTQANPHTDHVHLEITTGYTYKPPAVSKPPTSTQPPANVRPPTSGEVYLDKLRPGQKNSDSVYYWRMAMNAITLKGGRELPLNRDYTADLVSETKKFQAQKANDPQDGWPGPKQAELGFRLAAKEMRAKGIKTLSIYRNSKTGGLVAKVW